MLYKADIEVIVCLWMLGIREGEREKEEPRIYTLVHLPSGSRVLSLGRTLLASACLIFSSLPSSMRIPLKHSEKAGNCAAQQRSIPRDWLPPRALTIGMCLPPREDGAGGKLCVIALMDRPAFLLHTVYIECGGLISVAAVGHYLPLALFCVSRFDLP